MLNKETRMEEKQSISLEYNQERSDDHEDRLQPKNKAEGVTYKSTQGVKYQLQQKSTNIRIAWRLLIVNDILLFPCAILSIARFVDSHFAVSSDLHYYLESIDYLMRYFSIIPISSRTFFIPYLLAGASFVLGLEHYFDERKKQNSKVRIKISAIIAGIFCVIGLISVEIYYQWLY